MLVGAFLCATDKQIKLENDLSENKARDGRLKTRTEGKTNKRT